MHSTLGGLLRCVRDPRFIGGNIPQMKLTVDRHEPGFTCTIGDLLIDGVQFCNTLEDLPHATKIDGETRIPAGIYSVGLTTSPSVQSGRLWSPSPSGLLPLLAGVPGFDGVRIHAGNTDRDTRGCILVGFWGGGEYLSSARQALTLLMDKMKEADGPFTIEVCDP